MNDILLRLAQEEAKDAQKNVESIHDMPPSIFLQIGLELKEQQYVIHELYMI